MIVADTGAVVALVDADSLHHRTLRRFLEIDPSAWVLPWSVLPEIDYLLATRFGPKLQVAFLEDLCSGAYAVEWGQPADLERAKEITDRWSDLRLGLVDATVMAVAERLGARAIATLDQRHFGTVEIRGQPKILPRDLPLLA